MGTIFLIPVPTPFSTKLKTSTTTPADGGSNFVVLNYVDVLLMMAEDENELGNAETKTLQNLVRKRAGLADAIQYGQVDVRAAITLEKRLKLIREGHRRFDLLQPVPQDQIDTDPAIK